jgi:hypothetical protein
LFFGRLLWSIMDQNCKMRDSCNGKVRNNEHKKGPGAVGNA